MNARRRQRYQEDGDYRGRAVDASRAAYKKKKTGRQTTRKKPDILPNSREVVAAGGDPVYLECFTIPEAAAALGKTPQTFRRWLVDNLVPSPRLVDTVRGHAQYTATEVRVMRECLDIHHKTYDYLHVSHQETINRIWQHIEAYRKGEIYD